MLEGLSHEEESNWVAPKTEASVPQLNESEQQFNEEIVDTPAYEVVDKRLANSDTQEDGEKTNYAEKIMSEHRQWVRIQTAIQNDHEYSYESSIPKTTSEKVMAFIMGASLSGMLATTAMPRNMTGDILGTGIMITVGGLVAATPIFYEKWKEWSRNNLTKQEVGRLNTVLEDLNRQRSIEEIDLDGDSNEITKIDKAISAVSKRLAQLNNDPGNTPENKN